VTGCYEHDNETSGWGGGGVKRPGREDDHPVPSSAEFKNV
jgi:hypothetical protein